MLDCLLLLLLLHRGAALLAWSPPLPGSLVDGALAQAQLQVLQVLLEGATAAPVRTGGSEKCEEGSESQPNALGVRQVARDRLALPATRDVHHCPRGAGIVRVCSPAFNGSGCLLDSPTPCASSSSLLSSGS